MLKKREKSTAKKWQKKIQQRINEIKSAESVEYLIQYQIGRCHRLKGKKKDQYAVDIVHPFRMLFVKNEKEYVRIVKIIEITDYH